MSDREIIGNRLKIFRKSLKLSLVQMENATGHNYANISRIESGKMQPSFEFLSILHKKFNLNLHWLINGVGNMFHDSEEKISSSLRDLFPGIPNEELADDMIKCLQVPVIYHYFAALFIPLKHDHLNFIDKYFNEQEVKSNVG